ncbi:hypothetical protein Tco_0781424 [Tanacetum coccineum]
MDKIHMSHAQILSGMFYKKNIDYVYLLWEDFLFHIENKDAKKTNKMSYPRFTKIIINHFMSKDQSILRRNKMFWHTTRDDTMFTSMRCISRHEDTQVYGTILPKELTNQAMLKSKAYQTYYAFASREKALKLKLKSKAKVAKSDKKKQPAKMPKAKGLNVLSEVALTEASYQKKQDSILQLSHKWLSDKEDDDDVDDSGDEDDDDNNDDDDDDNDGNNNDEADSKRTGSDRDKIPDPNLTNVEQTEQEDRSEDAEMTDADQGGSEQHNVS